MALTQVTKEVLHNNQGNITIVGTLESLTVAGATELSGNLTVQGNLFVNGNTTIINANNININDSMIYMADDNPADSLDIGFVSSFTNPGYQHTGLVRDATDGTWKLFANVVPEPTTTVDFTNATFSNLRMGNLTAISATISGNISAMNFSGNLIGTPHAPTASAGTNTTQIATTAYVQTAGQNSQGTKTVQSVSAGVPSNSTGNNGDIIYQY